MNQREAEGMQYLGIVLASVGIGFIYWPAALIVFGLALVVLAQAGAGSEGER